MDKLFYVVIVTAVAGSIGTVVGTPWWLHSRPSALKIGLVSCTAGSALPGVCYTGLLAWYAMNGIGSQLSGSYATLVIVLFSLFGWTSFAALPLVVGLGYDQEETWRQRAADIALYLTHFVTWVSTSFIGWAAALSI